MIASVVSFACVDDTVALELSNVVNNVNRTMEPQGVEVICWISTLYLLRVLTRY